MSVRRRKTSSASSAKSSSEEPRDRRARARGDARRRTSALAVALRERRADDRCRRVERDGGDSLRRPPVHDARSGASGLATESLFVSASGVLDKTAEGLGFASFALEVRVRVEPERIALANRVVEKAKRSCIVANALRVPVTLDAFVGSADDRPGASG